MKRWRLLSAIWNYLPAQLATRNPPLERPLMGHSRVQSYSPIRGSAALERDLHLGLVGSYRRRHDEWVRNLNRERFHNLLANLSQRSQLKVGAPIGRRRARFG